MKVRFDEVFTQRPDGSFSPNIDIRFNGDCRKAGASIFPGANFGRIDLSRHIGHDVEIEQDEKAAVVIMGFYP